MRERNYQFRERLLEVHRPGRRMPWAVLEKNQIEITSDWTIWISDEKDIVVYNAARDLEDYFAVSMGVCVRFQIGGEIPKKTIAYSLDENLSKNEYRVEVSESRVDLCGSNSRTSAQAGYFVEDLMNFAEAPFLDIQEQKRETLFSPRMVHSGFGLDMYPDEHLRYIAHAGIDAILIFVCDVDLTPIGYLDFNDLIYRASRWGLDVYAYSRLVSEVYPEGEEGERYYEGTYGKLFRECPKLKGVYLVGESCEFPSRDEHTTGILRIQNPEGNGNPFVNGVPSPGWWPCYDFPIWLNMVKKIIYKYNPDAEIIFDTYNWGYVEEKYRLDLLEHLPKDISLMQNWEMFGGAKREGIYHKVTDYTLFCDDASEYFFSEARFAKKEGLKLYSMSNAAGLTWDVGVIPYEPTPYQWIKRFEKMRKAHEDFGLCGTMDNHHYGIYPSFIVDLAKWAFHNPMVDLKEVLRKIAVRDFSEEVADEVLRAWKYFSDGISMLVSTEPDQYGPFRVGPAYPLLLFKGEDVVFSSPTHALHGGNMICNPMYNYPLHTEEDYNKFHSEIRCFTRVYELYDEGCKVLEPLIDLIHESKQMEARRMLNVGKFIANSARTAVHVKEWYLRKLLLQNEDESIREQMIAEMQKIGLAELENARNTIPYVEFDSRLGWEASMEYMCDREHIEWKINLTKQVLEEELAEYRRK